MTGDISTIDSNHIIDLLAAGNGYIWTLTVLVYLCLFMLAWIKFEPSIRSLFFLIGGIFSNRDKEEKEKENYSLSIKATHLFDKISLTLTKVSTLTLSKDIGRNIFYHYVLKEALNCLFEDFKNSYEDLQNGKITQVMFCSYSGYHAGRISKGLEKFQDRLEKRLKEEGWEDDKIKYTINIFLQWISSNLDFLSDLISSSKMPTEVIMSWWVFYYEIYMNLEKFGIMLNGYLTGQTFEKIKLGKPTKAMR